jgi:hypothetical protein
MDKELKKLAIAFAKHQVSCHIMGKSHEDEFEGWLKNNPEVEKFYDCKFIDNDLHDEKNPLEG